MNRTVIQLAAHLCLVFLLAGCGKPEPDLPRPNIVLITLDTTRADHLSTYGYEKPTTPNLDALAAGGTIFTRAISAAAVTPVSLASIQTGLYPYQHGARVLHGAAGYAIDEGVETLSERLKERGYTTAAFVSAFPAGPRFGLDRGFDLFDAEFLKQPAEEIVSPSGAVSTGKNQRSASETTDLALDWLATAEEPYFLWLHYFDPHDPLLMPPGLRLHPPPRDARDYLARVYDVELNYMDGHIGLVMKALEESGQGDRSVVAVVADHGEGLGDHGNWTHGFLYQEQLRVPMILRLPGDPGGRKVESTVRSIDLAPTLLELAGIEAGDRREIEGLSLTPLLTEARVFEHRVAYADALDRYNNCAADNVCDSRPDRLYSIVDFPWKYIHHEGGLGHELYNLLDDPGETSNLIASRDGVRRRMLAILSRRIRDTAPETHAPMPEEDMKRLRALGYVE